MSQRLSHWSAVLFALLVTMPQRCMAGVSASTFSYGATGTPTVLQVFTNITSTLAATVIPVASAIFVVGAFLYLSAAEKEERKNQGKEFMIGALIGVGVVSGAKGIVNLVLFFIYS